MKNYESCEPKGSTTPAIKIDQGPTLEPLSHPSASPVRQLRINRVNDLTLIRRGHAVSFRRTDLPDDARQALEEGFEVLLPKVGVALRYIGKFNKAVLLKGWRWNDSKCHYPYPVPHIDAQPERAA